MKKIWSVGLVILTVGLWSNLAFGRFGRSLEEEKEWARWGEICKTLGGKGTSFQRDAVSKKYKGQWIQGGGYVDDVKPAVFTKGVIIYLTTEKEGIKQQVEFKEGNPHLQKAKSFYKDSGIFYRGKFDGIVLGVIVVKNGRITGDSSGEWPR